MIVEGHARRVAISGDVDSARYAGTRIIATERPADARTENSARVTVEILRQHGGMMARALLGGQFVPDRSDVTEFRVLVGSEPLGVGRPATAHSALAGPLVPGLPAEFAEAVLRTVSDPELGAAELPAGTLSIDRAAYDEVGSSESSFGAAARSLTHALAAELRGDDPTKDVGADSARW